jgi:hypothetical protein
MADRIPGFRLVATLMVVALQGIMIPVTAGESVAVNGLVVSTTDQQPVVGARIHLGDPETGQIYSSSPVSDDGSFAIEGVPAATYEVGVEHEGGLFVVDTPLSLAPGQSRPLTVAIDPQLAPSPEEAEQQQRKRAGRGVWNNPLTAALIVLGAAIVIGVIINEATDDDVEQPASP